MKRFKVKKLFAVINYSYDSLGRVESAVYPDGTKITYTYDANGNLLSIVKTN